MTDTNDQFLDEDDEILASILEESLRHYNEVEVPLRSIAVNDVPPAQSIADDDVPTIHSMDGNEVPQQSIGANTVLKLSSVASPVVIDLCQSPKKCTTVQSRLSHFFRIPKSVNICDEDTNGEQENETDQICLEINSSPIHNNNVNISSSPMIFYKQPDADGFHLLSGSHYVYPSNFPVREYQMGIIKTALFHNTLVSLPTGMGKTFIAAVVMYNFYRWYPMGKIIFMAPTRPLVAQQIEACHSIMGIPRDMTFEMTGNIPPEQRYLAWHKYRVFFLTPQVLANDLSLNKCPSDTFRCVIVDEAHRATKDYAYVQVLKHLAKENRVIRIVGLSATPGTNVEAVTEVIQNLNISRLEFRTDESPDVAKYTNKKDVECISVKLTNTILDLRNQFLKIYDKYLRRLKQYHALNGNVANLTKFQILGAKQKFLSSNNARDMPKSLIGCLINDFTICMSLAYALELLTIYGIKVFYLQSLEIKENHKCLSNDIDFRNLLITINQDLNSQDLTWSHPKLFELKKIVKNYFGNENVEANSKIIIFCQYRLVVVEVFELLKTFGSSVKPVMFVGQSLKEKGGLPQKKQLEVMSRFKSGDFNVLIATSVAEEGLDIGEVDLIICLEANKSPIKFVQRLGRTGRKRSGKCITLLTEGKEQIKYNSSVSSSKTLVNKMLKNKSILSKLTSEGPRLVPKHIHPQCLMIHVKEPVKLFPENKKLKGKRKVVENIMQYVESNDGQNEVAGDEEDGLDIFQNNIDKPKRRSKKRKTVELGTSKNGRREVGSPEQKNTDMDFEHYSNDNCFSVPHETEKASNHFVDEEKVFNEWLHSCVETNTIVMNSPFFELLNFFTDHSTETNNGEPTNGMFTGQPKFGQMFGGPSVFEERTIHINEQPMRNADYSFRLSNDARPGTSHDSQMISTTAARNIDYARSADYKDMFNRHTDNSAIVRPIGIRTIPEIGGKHQTKNDENLGFNDLFKSQRVDEYTKDCMMKNTGLLVRQPTADDRDGDSMVDLAVHYVDDDDSSAEIVTRDMEHDDNQDEDDEVMGNLDFEELFKSQRADMYIKKYTEEIVTEQPKVDHLADNTCNDRQETETKHLGKIDYSVLFKSQRSDGYIEDFMVKNSARPRVRNSVDLVHHVDDDDSMETIASKVVGSDDEEVMGNLDFEKLFKSQKVEKCMKKTSDKIDTEQPNINRSITNSGRRSPAVCGGGQKAEISGYQSIGVKRAGKIDYSVLFKSQRSDGYIEDFMVRNTDLPARPPTTNDDDGRMVQHIVHSPMKIRAKAAELDNDQNVDDDKVMGNLNFEKLQFKSQRSNKCMKKAINSGRRSPVLQCSGGPKTITASHSGKVDYSELFKNQRPDGYIEDYMEKVVSKTSTEKVGESNRFSSSSVVVIDDEDDDVISVSNSQEFFSCRPPKKKTVQTKLTSRVRADRTVEIVDLSSPPPRSSCSATASAASPPIRDDGFPTGDVTTALGIGLLQSNDHDDDDMDFMFIDYTGGDRGSDVFTQKHGSDVDTQAAQKQRSGGGTKAPVLLPSSPVASSKPTSLTSAKPPLKVDVTKLATATGHVTKSYDNDLMSFNIMKAARYTDLFKPRLSMKRNTTAAALKPQADNGHTALKLRVDNGSSAFKRHVDNGPSAFKRHVDNGLTAFKRQVDNVPMALKRQVDKSSMAETVFKRKIENCPAVLIPSENMSPIHPPNGQRRRPQFSQSTPKVLAQKQRAKKTITATVPGTVNSLLTSSSDSDAFVNFSRDEKTTSPRRRVKKKRRPKPKKKLLFIDDEADVSNCYGDGSILSTTSSDDDDNNDQNEFDSSFIDDDHDEKSDPSKSMTKQYLQSVKSQVNTRGVFKIPLLTKQHYNIDVYSQMEDRNVDNNYEEDSFCVEDASDLNNTSSTTNTSAQRTSDERPSKPSRKRKRIKSPQSTDSSDSPGDQFRRKCFKAKTSLDFF